MTSPAWVSSIETCNPTSHTSFLIFQNIPLSTISTYLIKSFDVTPILLILTSPKISIFNNSWGSRYIWLNNTVLDAIYGWTPEPTDGATPTSWNFNLLYASRLHTRGDHYLLMRTLCIVPRETYNVRLLSLREFTLLILIKETAPTALEAIYCIVSWVAAALTAIDVLGVHHLVIAGTLLDMWGVVTVVQRLVQMAV